MHVFIPISDEDLDSCPAGARLVPYQPGLWLLSQAAPADSAGDVGFSRSEAPAHPRDERPVPPPCRP